MQPQEISAIPVARFASVLQVLPALVVHCASPTASAAIAWMSCFFMIIHAWIPAAHALSAQTIQRSPEDYGSKSSHMEDSWLLLLPSTLCDLHLSHKSWQAARYRRPCLLVASHSAFFLVCSWSTCSGAKSLQHAWSLRTTMQYC